MAQSMVYVIDDDEAILRSVGFVLESLGYDCMGFQDGQAFLDEAQRMDPGFVLSDLRMPGLDGFEVRKALGDLSIAWPMVLMSSDVRFDLGRALEEGFVSFLRKPFSTDDLVAALESCSAADSRIRS